MNKFYLIIKKQEWLSNTPEKAVLSVPGSVHHISVDKEGRET